MYKIGDVEMKVIDLNEEHLSAYCVCLEEWSDEMAEAGDHKCQWYNKMKDKGLGVKLVLDDEGIVGGMIQYVPIEHSNVDGKDLYFIDCIWVHGYKEGRGDLTGKGMGTALLEAAEKDVRNRGAKGIVAWGLMLPFWMKASWYKKHGYTKVDKDGIGVLLWKPFTEDAVIPKWYKEVKAPKPNENKGKVTVTVFYKGHCPTQGIVLERTRRAVKQFDDQVILNEINTFERDVFLEWGIQDGLYIEGKSMLNGPPLAYDKIEKAISKAVKRLLPREYS